MIFCREVGYEGASPLPVLRRPFGAAINPGCTTKGFHPSLCSVAPSGLLSVLVALRRGFTPPCALSPLRGCYQFWLHYEGVSPLPVFCRPFGAVLFPLSTFLFPLSSFLFPLSSFHFPLSTLHLLSPLSTLQSLPLLSMRSFISSFRASSFMSCSMVRCMRYRQ